MKQFIVSLLYHVENDDLFYKIMEIVDTPTHKTTVTVKIIPADKIIDGKKMPSSEYDAFKKSHFQDIFLELGKIHIDNLYYELIQTNLKEQSYEDNKDKNNID